MDLGATRGQRILAPGFVTVLLFSFVFAWTNYLLPLIVLNDPTLYTITVGLAWNSQASAGGGAQALFPLIITGSLVSIVPISSRSCSCSGSGRAA
jgi:multiple sugar transport system permease protein